MKAITISIMFSLAGLTPACFAQVSLMARPLDGNRLSFNSVQASGLGANKEIRVQMISQNENRSTGIVRLFQRLEGPLENEKGEFLNTQAIQTWTQPDSNNAGTAYQQTPGNLTTSNQLLFSGQNGESDFLTIVYSLNRGSIPVGTYTGRLVLQALGSDGTSDEVTIDILVEASSNLKISLQGAHDPRKIHVKSFDTTYKTADYLNVSISGISGQDTTVYQEVEEFPANENSQKLGVNVIQTDVEGQTDGLRSAGLSTLENANTLLYSSNDGQDQKVNFRVYFLVDTKELENQAQGHYRGKLKYKVTVGQQTQEFSIDIECDIPPLFKMKVTTPEGLNFSHVLANSPPQDIKIQVTVESNLGLPYQVSLNNQTGMTSEDGKEFDKNHIALRVEFPEGQKGRTKFTDFSPLTTGEYPIFYSDPAGSSTIFIVDYRLQGYDQMAAGKFYLPLQLTSTNQ